MAYNKYSIEVKPQSKVVEIRFASTITLDIIEDVLNRLKGYVAENYQIKMIGYINEQSNYLRAFMLALSLFGNEDRVIFENKARFKRAERRLMRGRVRELRDEGYNVKQISERLNIPLKTIYRWLKD